ncbi:hypothetical protein C5167_046067 [Papaver somniferum]|uniref:Co-chaperone protein p23 n=1 Tax=Papaver somniferum TaxID=3469 RepID=A0A4Y7LG66_PAPSO|nr:co-chaperone protein p23-1-like [Papaver somniferum]RZC83281.1 hypothetical protein C5167_046067 [Papaver somniferum]
MSRHPTIKWAQRSDQIFLTVDLPDANDVKLKLEPQGRFVFSATKDGIPYEVDIELYDKINAEESKVNNGARNIVYVIKKTESKWWNRLLKQEGKPPVFLKVDWDKWIDEDDEKEKTDMDFNDMDFSNLNLGGDELDMDEPDDEQEGIEEEEEEEENKGDEIKKSKDEPVAAGSEEV